MDLKNGNITIGELLAYPPAKAILSREFPLMIHHPLAGRAKGMTLNMAIRLAGDALPRQKGEAVLEQLGRA